MGSLPDIGHVTTSQVDNPAPGLYPDQFRGK